MDNFPSEKMNFNQAPDTVKSIFFSYIGPEIIIKGNDTTKIYNNDKFEFVFIDSCVFKTELKFIPWIINSWFDHYDLVVNNKPLLSTKKLSPPFVIYKDKLFTSNILNPVDTSDYIGSELNMIDLTEKLNICK